VLSLNPRLSCALAPIRGDLVQSIFDLLNLQCGVICKALSNDFWGLNCRFFLMLRLLSIQVQLLFLLFGLVQMDWNLSAILLFLEISFSVKCLYVLVMLWHVSIVITIGIFLLTGLHHLIILTRPMALFGLRLSSGGVRSLINCYCRFWLIFIQMLFLIYFSCLCLFLFVSLFLWILSYFMIWFKIIFIQFLPTRALQRVNSDWGATSGRVTDLRPGITLPLTILNG